MDASSSNHRFHQIDEGEVPLEYCIGKQIVTPKGTKRWLPEVDESLKPMLDTTFNSLDDAYNFYKIYAQNGGFEPRKAAHKYLKKDSSRVKLKWFVCNKQGFKQSKVVNKIIDTTPECLRVPGISNRDDVSHLSENSEKKKKRRERPSIRTGCEACIRVEINSTGKFQVYVFVEHHNHPLVHPDYRKHLNSNRKLDFGQKYTIHKLGDAGIGASKAYRVLTNFHGGQENVGATSVESRNYRRDVNKFIGDADAQMVINMLNEKKDILPDFTFNHIITTNKELGGLFWADEMHKRNYIAFGDVVSFDATYRSNKYDMVFIPFTGIDNHNRCVTFGAGLLAKEDVVSYRWLLHQFKGAFPREPQIVLTDQDPAMRQAIKAEFSKARHRLCMWHIMEKLTVKVGAEICRSSFKKEFSRLVWTDKLDPHQFEQLWVQILEKYELLSNKWLNDMYALRELWIPAFFRDWPMSGLMRTSSRSESENSMFGQLMSSTSTLVEFFTFFEVAMNGQRFQQSKNDHQSKYTTPDLKTDILFEVDALNTYTRTVSVAVQNDICAAVLHCFCLRTDPAEPYVKYTIHDSSIDGKSTNETTENDSEPNIFEEYIPVNSEVFFNKDNEDVFCTCKKFERNGLLCRHIFYVFRINKIKKIPRKYIVSRWTRDSVPPKSSQCGISFTGTAVQNNHVSFNMREIYFTIDKAVSLLVGDNGKLNAYLESQKRLLEDIQSEMGTQQPTSNNGFISEMLGVKQPEKVDVFPPKGIRNKGSGKKRVRLIGSREEAASTSEKPLHLCRYCKVMTNKHDTRNCKKRKEDIAAAAAAQKAKAEADAKARVDSLN